MSLLLRQKCQEILDDVGLHNIHASINNVYKCIQLVGECGQPIVKITGITFSRLNPSNKEIEYCAELLEAFLIKHKLEIKTYITEKSNFQKVKDPRLKENYTLIENDYILFITEGFAFIYNGEKLFTIKYNRPFNSEYSTEISIKDYTKRGFSTSVLIGAVQYRTDVHSYDKQRNNLSIMNTKLNTCDI